VLKKINATGNPGCSLFNSECTISAGNTLRIGPGVAESRDQSSCMGGPVNHRSRSKSE